MASWREQLAAKAGMSLKAYLKTDAYKQEKKKRDNKDDDKKKGKGKNGYGDIVTAALEATPGFQEVLPDFEGVYKGDKLNTAQITKLLEMRPDVKGAFGTDEAKINEWWDNYGKKEMPDVAKDGASALGVNNAYSQEQEDNVQAKAVMEPYFAEQFRQSLEDLNAWTATENIDYDRSLKRARVSMAASGAGIGSERQSVEGEMSADHNTRIKNQNVATERLVGTDRMKADGKTLLAGVPVEGSTVATMKSSIADQALWYKNQRAGRYYGTANTYYQQDPSTNILGGKL